ncbi:universal stress protein [Kordiimonas pumila]|uniref:Universal stress protein n=1 Tax=Kordiimonas pumila TaxID=2161677 RepID=A0ABV7D915_9PROT|nr:universal stress protein [Kordiimonas pumila]
MIKDEIRGPIRPIKKRLRKLLVVVDGSPESKIAIRFAAARAAHITGGGLVLFHCIRPGEFQHWVAVADRMREEAYEAAQQLLRDVAENLNNYCGVTPDIEITEGEPKDELKKYMMAQSDLFGLVLGAGSEGDPGPLVDYFSSPAVSELSCPVIIVPGNMTYEQVDSMA